MTKQEVQEQLESRFKVEILNYMSEQDYKDITYGLHVYTDLTLELDPEDKWVSLNGDGMLIVAVYKDHGVVGYSYHSHCPETKDCSNYEACKDIRYNYREDLFPWDTLSEKVLPFVLTKEHVSDLKETMFKRLTNYHPGLELPHGYWYRIGEDKFLGPTGFVHSTTRGDDILFLGFRLWDDSQDYEAIYFINPDTKAVDLRTTYKPRTKT
jgi:hypothetical protein